MELLKLDERPVVYDWHGIKFLIKARMGAREKFEMDTCGELQKDGRVKYTGREYWRTLIRCFVQGWEGVTEDGKSVPYSFDNLERVPVPPKEDLFLDLGVFISNHFKLLEKDESKEQLKNA